MFVSFLFVHQLICNHEEDITAGKELSPEKENNEAANPNDIATSGTESDMSCNSDFEQLVVEIRAKTDAAMSYADDKCLITQEMINLIYKICVETEDKEYFRILSPKESNDPDFVALLEIAKAELGNDFIDVFIAAYEWLATKKNYNKLCAFWSTSKNTVANEVELLCLRFTGVLLMLIYEGKYEPLRPAILDLIIRAQNRSVVDILISRAIGYINEREKDQSESSDNIHEISEQPKEGKRYIEAYEDTKIQPKRVIDQTCNGYSYTNPSFK